MTHRERFDSVMYSSEAERAVLGTLLLDASGFHHVADQLGEEAFFLPVHRVVFDAIRQVALDGRQVDLITVADELRLRGQLDDVGGVAFLSELQLSVASALHLPSYIHTLRRFVSRRRILRIADLYARAGVSPKDKAEQLIFRARTLDGALQAEQAGQDWQVFSAMDAVAPRPPREDLVRGLIACPSLNVVYGAPGTLKSFLLADLAICMAAGLPWLAPRQGGSGGPGRATVRVPTLWLDADNGQRCTHDRIKALIQGHDLDPATLPFYYVSMPQPPFDASDPASIDALIRIARRLSVAAIFMDNLGVMSGSADENSADMAHVMANLRQIVEYLHAGVVVVHHQRKMTTAHARAGESLRGHTSIEAALDLALLVLREERSQRVTIRCTKSRGPDVAPFAAVFAFDHAPATDELAAARFYGVDIEDDSPPARARQALLSVLAAADDSLSQRTLVSQAREIDPDLSKNIVRSQISELTASGAIRMRVGGPHNAHQYSLPDP